MNPRTATLLGGLLFAPAVALASESAVAERPAVVSPGGRDAVLKSATNCPTFSWGGVAGAPGYELVVFRVPAVAGAEPEEALRTAVPARALSWTPSAAQCLAPGRYAWSVRAAGGDWSEARLFDVAAAELPGEREIERLVERVLERRLTVRPAAASPSLQMPVFDPAPPAKPRSGASHFSPPACAGTFNDVDNSNPFCGWIEQSYADGIFGSCATGPLRFCPDDTLTREQASMLLERGVQERWGLSGNAGTTAGTHFIGTTDDEALDFKVNGVRGLRIAPRADDFYGSIPSLIGGWQGNFITAGDTPTADVVGAVVGGGGFLDSQNRAHDDFDVVAGGWDNRAGTADNNPVFGGNVVGGGSSNIASGGTATVSGGDDNKANESFATVAGGEGNTASGSYATIMGGKDNIASANWATVAGGYGNKAAGLFSFAAGTQAKAESSAGGAFVWADSNPVDFSATSPNVFKVRATGGVKFVVGIDSFGATTWTCSVEDGDAGWSCSSDRNLKEHLVVADGAEILRRLAGLPLYFWNAKGQSTPVPHLGPMAQDFKAAFNLGSSDLLINGMDLDGVALAAIQALDRKLEEKDRAIAELAARVAELESAGRP